MTAPVTTPFPDAEALATAWLKPRLAPARVATTLQGWTKGMAWVAITRTGGVPRLWMRSDEPRLDVDCYGPDKAAAHDLAQLARAHLFDMPSGTHSGAVVSAVNDDTGLAWLPDPDTQAARYVFAVRVVLHPIP